MSQPDLELRAVLALESIAKSLEKLANPLVEIRTGEKSKTYRHLFSHTDTLIQTIKVVREYTGLTLTDAKSLVDKVKGGETVDLAAYVSPGLRSAAYLERFKHDLAKVGARTELVEDKS